MTRLAAVGAFLLVWTLGAAQDITITNARIIDGVGGTIANGSVVVSDGRIVSVSAGAVTNSGLRIDARGMTVMPAFVDAHRHIMQGDATEWLREQAEDRMQEYLDAGFTTILSAGDPLEGILELRRRLAEGEIAGPRLIAAGRVNMESRPAEVRAEVRALVEAGVDVIKTVFTSTEGGNEKNALAAMADEANRLGIPTIVHATAVWDMITTVEVGASRLVHTPHTGVLAETDGARIVYEAGVPMTSTLGVYAPIFDDNNVPRFRNGGPYPDAGWSRVGQGPVNARLLWDTGVTYGFGTDTRFLPRDSLAHELRPLQLVFSAKDIVTMLTRNAAAFLEMEDEIGTLEPGKLADIAILDGDPLVNIADVLNVEVVIQGGRIVVDNR